MKSLFIVLIFVGLVACQNGEEVGEVQTEVLTPVRMIDQFEGNIFFTHVEFNSDLNQVYLINKNPAMLMILDKDFNLKELVERRGNGPEDLSFPSQLQTTKFGLMVVDRGNHKISLINPENGAFIDEFFIPEAISHGKFVFDGEENFYFPRRGYESDEASVLKFNMNGEVVGKLGQEMPQEEGDFNRQSKILQRSDDGNLILIGVNLLYIDILSPDNKLLKRHSLNQFEPLKRALDSLENDFRNPGFQRNLKTVNSIIIDAQYTKGKLYLTFTDRIGLDRSKARQLLEFEISQETIKLSRIFRLQTGTFDDAMNPYSFHVDASAKRIYTQGLGTNQIYIFDLPE